ncbi:MAG: C4-type zinc ribbon domain-containing protein, partial [Verrucomicrobiota bacterium]
SKRLAAEESSLARTQELVDDELAQLKQREENELSRLAEFRSEREQYGSGLDDSLLSIYDRIFKNKGDAAVVPLVGQQCKGCHMRVTPSTVQKAKLEKEVTHCENCGRILYIGE